MTLVVYDTTGRVIQQITGNYTVPVGIPYLEFEVPPGRYVVSVDVSKNPHTAVLSPEPIDEKALAIEDLQKRMDAKDTEILMVLAAMAETYEAVLPFLPPQY